MERHQAIRTRWTAIAEAAASVGTPQIRNVGTLGGNLCQRPRCWYYRSELFHCLKKGGDHCYAEDGENAYHAIFGDGPCHIVHPSDVAPAIIALGGRMAIVGPQGRREVPAEAFYVMPDVDPSVETILKPNEMVTEVIVPSPPTGTKSLYLKQREKQSLDFALVGVAVTITTEHGVCRQARIILSGVAPVPWRAKEAEAVLIGKKISNKSPGSAETTPLPYPGDPLLIGKRIDIEVVEAAAEAALAGARPMRDNGYKVTLAKTLIQRAIMRAV
jgi:xanthine dehydrogenase YagS FAD-binding subunit